MATEEYSFRFRIRNTEWEEKTVFRDALDFSIGLTVEGMGVVYQTDKDTSCMKNILPVTGITETDAMNSLFKSFFNTGNLTIRIIYEKFRHTRN